MEEMGTVCVVGGQGKTAGRWERVNGGCMAEESVITRSGDRKATLKQFIMNPHVRHTSVIISSPTMLRRSLV